MPGYPTDRVIVYNRDATYAFELTPDEQRSRKRIEEVNGEHSLTIRTTRRLTEGMRLITQDDTGKVREHVVYKPDAGHHEGKYAIGTYLCMWSLQYDLTTSYAEDHAEPGMGSSCTSRAAVVAALDGQSLWEVGTCDTPSVAAGKGCVMIGISDWERLSLVVEHWHGEVDAEIIMDGTRVVSRKVNLLAHVGSSEVTRRFDWAEDLTSIDRHEDPGPYYCRVVPLGRGQREYAEDDETEFDWPIDISEETPDGRVYIEDSESAQVFRTKLPDGTWHYPTKVVHYDEDDPELLLNAAMEDLHNHTRPGASYEASVLQFARAGMDVKGVQLGDNTQCVDFGFSPDAGLALEGRITRLEVEELAPETETILTIGDLAPTFAQTMQELVSRQTASISDGIKRVEGGGTIAYVEGLLDAINAQIAADGGYTYLVGGQGSITYDRAVADPTIGTEATKVTQIKGGGIRIADEKKPSFSGIEDWVWKSLIVAGHIAAELVTAAHITAGYIGSSGDTYIDLDNHTAQLGQTSGPHMVVDSSGAKIYNGSTLLGFFGIESNVGIVRMGQASQGNVVASSSGYVDVRNSSTILAHFGYADGTNQDGTVSKAPYYDVGVRKTNTTIGNYSLAMGFGNEVSGYCSASIGRGNVVSGYYSLAVGGGIQTLEGNNVGGNSSACIGTGNTVAGSGSLCVGDNNTSRGHYRALIGRGLSDNSGAGAYGLICGMHNDVSIAYGTSFIVGVGKQYNRHTAFSVGGDGNDDGWVRVHNLLNVDGRATFDGIVQLNEDCYHYGNVYVNNTLVHSSDRRLKDHVAYLDDDAVDFVRALRPVRFKWKRGGGEHYGFYAQDVQEADPNDTETVIEAESDEKHGFTPLALDYNALIAPLVAYAQSLEKRIEAQDKTIEAMEARLAALEAKLA